MRIKSLLFGLFCVCATGCEVTSHHETSAPKPMAAPSAPADIIVFCDHCGILAGTSTSCPNFTSHEFRSAPAAATVVCSHCGAKPAETGTTCPNYTSHSFKTFTK